MVITVGHEHDPAKRLRKKQGDRLKEIRVTFRRLSMNNLVERMNAQEGITITQQAVSLWERGETTPRPHLQIAIARALDVPPSSIWNLDSEMAS